MRSRVGNSGPNLTIVHEHLDMPTMHLDDYELWQSARRLSPLTINERSRVLSQFHAETGVQPAQAKAPEIMRWFVNHNWSDSTHCTYYSYLNAWFKWMQAQDLRPDNPMVKIGSPKPPERLPRPVSDADVRALLTTTTHLRSQAMIMLAGLQGLRVHEIAKVRAEDVDLERGDLHVKGKGGSNEALPLHPRVAELAWRMPRRGLWFPSQYRGGEPIRSKSVSQAISNNMDRCGIRATPHALRHYFATRLLADGADIYTVRALMRHKNVSTTAIYAKLPDELRRGAIERIDPWDRPNATALPKAA